MLTPIEVWNRKPRHAAVSNLHHAWGVYACAVGFLRPQVLVDRKAEVREGFNSLIWHESLHAVEHHALFGVFVLLVGMVGFSVAVVLELWLSAVLCPFAGLAAWAFWRREQEVRADAVALYGAGVGGLGEEHPFWAVERYLEKRAAEGLMDFRAFLYLHPHPCEESGLSRVARWWAAWKYAPSRDAREARAAARCRRLGWRVPTEAGQGSSVPSMS